MLNHDPCVMRKLSFNLCYCWPTSRDDDHLLGLKNLLSSQRCGTLVDNWDEKPICIYASWR
ncbi:hypothetical protein DAI22_04g091600 [Oryza sativa Japonica Group]|nr:hypothetical protein DAI22_04g091600 [Oryza sativa Japonica Group]